MKNGRIIWVVATNIGESPSAPEGVWMQEGGIEIPFKYTLHGMRKGKIYVHNVFMQR